MHAHTCHGPVNVKLGAYTRLLVASALISVIYIGPEAYWGWVSRIRHSATHPGYRSLPCPGVSRDAYLSVSPKGKEEQLGKLVTDCPGLESNPGQWLRRHASHFTADAIGSSNKYQLPYEWKIYWVSPSKKNWGRTHKNGMLHGKVSI